MVLPRVRSPRGPGAFVGDPVELLDGELYVAEPQGTYHASHVGAAVRAIADHG